MTSNGEESDLTTRRVDLPRDSLSGGEPADVRRGKVDYRDPLHIRSWWAYYSMIIGAAVHHQGLPGDESRIRSCKKDARVATRISIPPNSATAAAGMAFVCAPRRLIIPA
jgi:hypothetical protein